MRVAESQDKFTSPAPACDFTGWLLEDVRTALPEQHLKLIETAPPREAGPIGDWRVLRCRILAVATESGPAQIELLIAREQLPKTAA